MDVDGVRAHLSGIFQQTQPGVLVSGRVRVLADRHAEDLAELGPVSDIAALVKGVGGAGGQLAEPAFRPRADEQAVREGVQRGSVHVGLVQEDLALDRVEVLPVDQVERDPAVLVAPELAEGEAPELRVYRFLDEPAEPGAPDLLIHLVDRLPVALELEALASDGAQALVDDAGQVSVRLQDGVVNVVELRTVVEVDGAGGLQGRHVARYVEVEELRALEYYGKVLLYRGELGDPSLRDLSLGRRAAAFVCHG